jgi:hypothetical protein
MGRFLRAASTLLMAPLLMATAQQKPITYPPFSIDYAAAPTTVEGLLDEADAVVVMRVTGRHPAVQREPKAIPRTAYGVHVIEVIKAHPKLSASDVEIERYGGDLEKGDHIERFVIKGFPDFQQGHRYVVFLKWNEILGRFTLVRGPDSAFELNVQGNVEAYGRFTAAKGEHGKDTEAFLNRLRDHEARQR